MYLIVRTMPSFIFPCEYIYWRNVDNHEEIKNKLIPQIENAIDVHVKDHNPFNGCKMKGSIFEDTKKTIEVNKFLFEDDIVRDIIWNTLEMGVKHLYDEKGVDICLPEKSYISEAWFNVYEKGDYQESHAHVGPPCVCHYGRLYETAFSFVYILNNKEKDGDKLVFQKKTLRSNACHERGYHEFATSEIPGITEGTVIMFPSCLDHYVRPITESGRITLAYNMKCSWFQEN